MSNALISNSIRRAVRASTAEETPLFVSKPLLPDLNDLSVYLKQIWTSERVTNHGPFSLQLEDELSRLLEVPTAMLFNNGTIGLLTALKLLDLPIGSEVITTPMTFAATAHAIAWNNLKPVFADINDIDLTLNPEAVALAITPNTSAILAVHVYGCICDHDALQALATANGLKLIYDAAHAFGTRRNGASIATLGDASVFSFHATKLYNTIEGGLVATRFPEDREKIYFIRNFGIKNEEEVISIGLNGKMNELQAAIGLLNLKTYEEERKKRIFLREVYHKMLDGVNGLRILEVGPGITQSEQYFVVRVDPNKFGRDRDEIKNELDKRNIFCRKYFYPLCTDFIPYRDTPLVSTQKDSYAEIAKKQVLCLPFHSGVTMMHVDIMADVFGS